MTNKQSLEDFAGYAISIFSLFNTNFYFLYRVYSALLKNEFTIDELMDEFKSRLSEEDYKITEEVIKSDYRYRLVGGKQ